MELANFGSEAYIYELNNIFCHFLQDQTVQSIKSAANLLIVPQTSSSSGPPGPFASTMGKVIAYLRQSSQLLASLPKAELITIYSKLSSSTDEASRLEK